MFVLPSRPPIVLSRSRSRTLPPPAARDSETFVRSPGYTSQTAASIPRGGGQFPDLRLLASGGGFSRPTQFDLPFSPRLAVLRRPTRARHEGWRFHRRFRSS